MAEYAANPCRGETCGDCDHADRVALLKRIRNRCVPHATSLLELLGESSKSGDVLGDIIERVGDHAARLIQPHLNLYPNGVSFLV